MSSFSSFSNNELKILKFFLEEFDYFEFTKRDGTFSISFSVPFENLQLFSNLSFKNTNKTDECKISIFLNKDKRLSILFDKSNVFGDKCDDIISKNNLTHDNPYYQLLKNLKSILSMLVEKNLFQNISVINHSVATELCKDFTKNIFGEFKMNKQPKKVEKENNFDTKKDTKDTKDAKDNDTSETRVIYKNTEKEIKEMFKNHLGPFFPLIEKPMVKKLIKHSLKNILHHIHQIIYKSIEISMDEKEFMHMCKSNLKSMYTKKVGKDKSEDKTTPLNPFMNFRKEKYQEFKVLHNNNFQKINQELSKQWKSFSEQDKLIYK